MKIDVKLPIHVILDKGERGGGRDGVSKEAGNLQVVENKQKYRGR